jgi:hypothetical protein
MAHRCLRFWGNHLDRLVARLDAGANKGKGPGWARRLAKEHEYSALLLLRSRVRAAGSLNIQKPGPWQKGKVKGKAKVEVAGLLTATCNLIGGLEADRLSTSTGHHDAGQKTWHASGSPDPAAARVLKEELEPRMKHAFGV